MKTQFKLGWLNATIWQRASDCFQLTIEYPVKAVQCFRTKAEAHERVKAV
jgi:hypothetical protein